MLDQAAKPYPPEGAFVLQFALGTDRFLGRVEHVVTGQAARFESHEDLTTFIARVLVEDSDAREPSEPGFRQPLS